VAPDILEGANYGARVDLWSMGVVAFVLLGGYPPFYEESRDDLYARIRNGEYEFHDEYWGRISDEAKTFVAKLLVVDPRLRYSANSALHVDRWMREEDEKLHVRTIRKSNRATKSNLYRQPSLGHHASTTSFVKTRRLIIMSYRRGAFIIFSRVKIYNSQWMKISSIGSKKDRSFIYRGNFVVKKFLQ
jgi:serine/threonine protein kinase